MARIIRNKLLELAIVASLAIAPAASHAGAMAGGASEVTQILNNIQLLMQTVGQNMQYATQLEQYYAQLKQLESAGLQSFGGAVGDAARMYAKAQELTATSNRFFGSLQSLQGLAERRYQEFAASGLTWEAYVEQLGKANELRGQTRQVMTGQEVATIERVQRNWEQLRTVSAEIPATQGTHSAMQVMNGQMAMLNGTLNEMLAFQAAQSRMTSERTIIEDVKVERKEQSDALLAQRMREEAEALKKEREYWTSKQGEK